MTFHTRENRRKKRKQSQKEDFFFFSVQINRLDVALRKRQRAPGALSRPRVEPRPHALPAEDVHALDDAGVLLSGDADRAQPGSAELVDLGLEVGA